MTHLYISGPMTGYPDYNFPAFERAARQLRAVGYDVTSPHELAPSTDKAWADYLRADLIAMLTHCTAVATLRNWGVSRGATLEVRVARSVSMTVYPVEWWAARDPETLGIPA